LTGANILAANRQAFIFLLAGSEKKLLNRTSDEILLKLSNKQLDFLFIFGYINGVILSAI